MQKYKTFIMGNTITWPINCSHRTAAALYALGIWFHVYNCKYRA